RDLLMCARMPLASSWRNGSIWRSFFVRCGILQAVGMPPSPRAIHPFASQPNRKVSPMKLIVRAIVLACAATWSVAITTPAAAQGSPELRNSQIETVYVEPKDTAFTPIYERLRKRRVLEQLELFLAPLRLPRKVQVKIDQCGAPFADYKPGGPVTICYEYIDQIEKLAPGGPVLFG